MRQVLLNENNNNQYLIWTQDTHFILQGSSKIQGLVNLFINKNNTDFPTEDYYGYILSEGELVDITQWLQSYYDSELNVIILVSQFWSQPFIFYLNRIINNDFITIEDKNISYNCYLNYDKSIPTLKNIIGVTNQFNNKYPYIVKNSNQNYYTGTITGTFVQENDEMQWGYDFTNAVQYRTNLKKWLYNGQPKILTLLDGNKFIIGISGNINDNVETTFDNVITTFNWYEIAEYNNNNLYEYGFIENDDGWKADWYGLEPPTDDSLSKMQLEKLLKYTQRDETDVINFNNNQIEQLRNYAFANSMTIISVKMTAVQSVGDYAFYGCNNMQEAIFTQVTSIKQHAFENCSNLYNLVIKTNSVCSLGTQALLNTPLTNSSITTAYLYVPDSLRNSYATSWGIDIAKIKSIEGSDYDG